MSWILLTNDDGIDSPALVPLARALSELGEVEVVVPAEERSWIGKAISRHEPIHTRVVVREGIPMTTCSGYPADCTQLGVHHLRAEPPELIVSGINLGYNHGAGFIWCSGTIGAAIEGWSSGVRSVAFSAGTMDDFEQWRAEVIGPRSAATWERLSALTVDLVRDLLEVSIWDDCDVVNINYPSSATLESDRWVTEVAMVGYTSLFDPAVPSSELSDDAEADTTGHNSGAPTGVADPEPADSTFEFTRRLGLKRRGEVARSDVDAALADAVSITPLHMPTGDRLGGADRARLERSER